MVFDIIRGMKNINTSTFDFPTLIREGFVYVDKTAQIYELARRDRDGIYFFPRPRRFGKSLLISTFKALFQGRRELFRGLAIEQTDWDWDNEVYPVLHLDMSDAACADASQLDLRLNLMLEPRLKEFVVEFNPALPAAGNFLRLINALPDVSRQMRASRRAASGKAAPEDGSPDDGKYVLLIDEYDAPIAGLLDTEETRRQLPAVRKALHDFYMIAKSHCGDMRFLFVTGVSKFAKTSIFSAFNNPKDLSLDVRAADLLGYTHDEVETYFHEHIQALADERGLAYEEMKNKLFAWYDSYQFSPRKLVKVVNPVSFGRALDGKMLLGWWEATAGSTLVFDALRAENKTPIDFNDDFAVSTLDAPDALEASATALLYQGGYLTIDHVVSDRIVRLKVPNREVRESLERVYVSRLLGKDFELDRLQITAEKTARQLAAEGYTESFKTMLQSAYSRLPHDWVCKDEKEAKRYFLSFMVFANADVVGEEQHATGRPDAVLSTEKGVYIFEFKYDQSADAALKQCCDRNYAAAFAGEGLPVYYVGVNYNPADGVRTADDVKCEPAG